nr:hypothetical protein [Tanacetum cinerariifolium]
MSNTSYPFDWIRRIGSAVKSEIENTGYSQEPSCEESPVEAIATSPPKTKKVTKARQKRMIQSDDASRQIMWTHEEEIALAKGWVDVFENSRLGNSRKEAGFWAHESGAGDEDYVNWVLMD